MSQGTPAEFLTQALSRRGNGELPYNEDMKWTIRQHILDLMQEFPTLAVNVATYTHMDGRAAQLLKAAGTLPMYYQNVKYNIPVSIWLPERYPRQPPLVYVVPTPDMVIKPRHSFVDASGVVKSSYVRNWTFPRSNLVDMSHDTSIQFGEDPPLFSKPLNWEESVSPAAPPPRIPQPDPHNTFHAQNPMIRPSSGSYSSTSPYGGASSTPYATAANPYSNINAGYHNTGRASTPATEESLWNAALNAAMAGQGGGGGYPSVVSEPSPPPPTPPPPPPPPKEDLKGVFRVAAVAVLTQRLQASLATLNSVASAEMDRVFETQGVLTARGEALRRGVAAMAAEKDALEKCVAEMNTKGLELERWLAQNESKTPDGNVDPDEAIVPADGLCGQALQAQAEDMAIEDALYALEKALQAGTLDTTTYLKQVRTLCAKQFYARALGMKVAARQHEHQGRRTFSTAAQLNARLPPVMGSVQMSQGDSWVNTGILANPLASR